MYTFPQLLSAAPSGLYRLNGNWRSRSMDSLCRLKAVRLFRIEGATVHDRKRFLRVAARTLGCPGWFGANWDAFADCATDLSWVKAGAYVVVLGHMRGFAAQAPKDFHTALIILEQAAQFWTEQGVPLHVLVAAHTDAAESGLPAVSAP